MVTVPKLFNQLFSCIFLLFLLNPFLSCSHARKYSSHPHSSMDFLQTLIGTKKGHSAKGLSQLKKYLSNLGYINTNNNHAIHENNDLFDNTLEQAIQKYQNFFKLRASGVLDNETVAKMRQPRCGMPDFVNIKKTIDDQIQNITSSHYTFFPGTPKWPPTKRNLTYSFLPGTRADAHRAILDATNVWASVSPFKFKYIRNYKHADIKISFEHMNHGDGGSFDGAGGVLAHAFGPPDGRLHYDADETWVDGVKPGAFDLQTIGLHELGHVLGLGHSPDGGAIMYPTIGNGFRKGLGKDDIEGIKALYPS